MDDFLDQSAVAQLSLLRSGRVSATEVMAATLARVRGRNEAVNAIVSLRPEDALMQDAQLADAARDKGALHGLPVAVKDLANVAGMVTSMGSSALAAQTAATSDVMVARMQEAGAIVIGKTNTPEFGLGSHTYNPVHGVTRNPWDRHKSAGGSSGGAAVALACGMLSLADGSDMMGSLRNPAGWNNVYGMRPSWGLVPSEPRGDTFMHQLATNGPMARTPEDIALLLQVQAGRDPRQPHGSDLPATPLDVDIRGLRIGWLGDWGGAWPMEQGVLDTCEAALSVFADMGCTVETLAAPFDRDAMWDSWVLLRSWSVAMGLAPVYADARMRATLKPEAVWEIERGLALSATSVHQASTVRSAWFETAAALFETFDVLVLPTAQCWPFPVDWAWPKSIAGVQMDTYHRWMECVVPVSLIGLPCLAVPAGFGPAGLPMGLQLAGRRGDNMRLLQLGHAWHQAANWTRRRPPM